MPIVSSQIIEDSPQADGRRWILAKATTSTGRTIKRLFKVDAGVDAKALLASKVAKLNKGLFEHEIQWYLGLVERGENVIGLNYVETTQAQRALRFVEWGKQMVKDGNHQALRYAYKVTDEFTVAQIDGLLGAGMGTKIKAWAEKLRYMDIAMNDSTLAAEDI